MTIYIKNMVCVRCKMAVQAVLDAIGIPYQSIELGFAVLKKPLTQEQHKQLNAGLQHYHLELMQDRKKIIAERIKTFIFEILRDQNDMPLKLSVVLSESLNYNYTHLANVFSESEGMTIEKFFIVNRIERVKEMMVYEDLTLNEIAWQLNYSSVPHLSAQFKKITGQTPATFKKLCQSANFVWKKV